MPDKPSPVHLTDAEWKVLNAVWQSVPASARDVIDRLHGDADWAYTTVKTMLARLSEKGAVSTERRGNTVYYTPLVSKPDARRSAIQDLVNRAFDGAFVPLLQFLVEDGSLSPRDRAELSRLLREDSERNPSAEGRDVEKPQ